MKAHKVMYGFKNCGEMACRLFSHEIATTTL